MYTNFSILDAINSQYRAVKMPRKSDQCYTGPPEQERHRRY